MNEISCKTCKYRTAILKCKCDANHSGWEPKEDQSITFKQLNGLTPTVESCTMKIIEELGELCQLIGKQNQASGEPQSLNLSPERFIGEAFDVAQSAVTMIYTIADKWGIDVTMQQELHEKKLRERGYMR